MNNQFLTQFLREEQEEVNKSIENIIAQTGADQDLVDFIMNAIRQGAITPEKAIQIIRDTFNGVNEDGMGGGSTTGGGVTNGATFTPGTGEQYAAGTRKVVRKNLEEDDALPSSLYQELMDDIVDKANNNTKAEYDFTIEALKHLKLYNEDHLKGFYKFAVGANYHSIAEAVRDVLTGKVSLKEDAPRLAGEKSKTDKQGARNLSAYTKDGFTKAPSAEEAAKSIKGVEVKDLWGKKALEETYYSFRNETKTRGKSEQFHEAVKIINKKLDEVNRLLEFTGTLKTELSEGEDAFEVKTNTKKSMDKVRGKVIEAYQKLKQL